MFSSIMSTDIFLNLLKIGLFCSAFSTKGAIVIKPFTQILGNFAISCTSCFTSSHVIPNFVSSSATFTSIKILTQVSFLTASRLISSASRRESTLCINDTLSTIYFTLFLWRCPIICQRISLGITSYLSSSSCTLFSPKSLHPYSYASLSISTGLVLLTAISVTSSGARSDS